MFLVYITLKDNIKRYCQPESIDNCELNDVLDTNSLTLKGITTQLDIQPLDAVIFSVENESGQVIYERRRKINSFQEYTQRRADQVIYGYLITLISETKELETIPLPNLVITNDNELSVLDYIKRYNEIYGHYTINEQKFIEEGFIGQTGSSSTHESEIVSGAITQEQIPLTINNGTRSDHFLLTLGNTSGEDVYVELPQQNINIGGYEVRFNAKKKALLKNTTITIASEDGQFLQKPSGNYQFVKCDLKCKVADGTDYEYSYANKQLIQPTSIVVEFIDNQAKVLFTNPNDCIVNYSFLSSQGQFIPISATAGRYDGQGGGNIELTGDSGTINYTIGLSCEGYNSVAYNGSFTYSKKTFTFEVGDHINHAYYYSGNYSQYKKELEYGSNVITAYSNSLNYYGEPSSGYYYEYNSIANHGTLNAGNTAYIEGVAPQTYTITYSGSHYSETASGTMPTSIIQGQSVNIDLTADNGYRFNTSNPPTATNGTISNIQYNAGNNRLSFTLSGVNANTSVSINTEAITFDYYFEFNYGTGVSSVKYRKQGTSSWYTATDRDYFSINTSLSSATIQYYVIAQTGYSSSTSASNPATASSSSTSSLNPSTINVSCSPLVYSIECNSDYIEDFNPLSITYGTSVNGNIEAWENYKITNLTATNCDITIRSGLGTDGVLFTLSNPTGNVVLNATAVLNSYTITWDASYRFTSYSPISISAGQSVSCSVSMDDEYDNITDITCSNGTIRNLRIASDGRSATFTLSGVSANTTINVWGE